MTKKKKIVISKKIEGLDEDERAALMSDIKEEDDDKIENNALIKVGKPTVATSSKKLLKNRLIS